jgi:hypothetical protein
VLGSTLVDVVELEVVNKDEVDAAVELDDAAVELVDTSVEVVPLARRWRAGLWAPPPTSLFCRPVAATAIHGVLPAPKNASWLYPSIRLFP